jgi:hypothetical protein
MKKFALTISVACLLGFATPLQAAGTTAGELFEMCSKGPDGEDYRLCQGFMAGYAQGIFGLATLDKSQNVCLPEYFAGDELLAIFMRTMKGSTKDGKFWKAPAGPLLMAVLTTQFACKH